MCAFTRTERQGVFRTQETGRQYATIERQSDTLCAIFAILLPDRESLIPERDLPRHATPGIRHIRVSHAAKKRQHIGG